MAVMYKSFSTIASPEFINLEPVDINPLMSKCEIKVLYIGENRNRSYISKEVAMDMAKTLRGCPIVGYWKEQKGDYADHGNQLVFDDEGMHFNCLTQPYGFVSPDADVWFQKFIDQDEFGNEQEHEYLMTTGYLWTKQFEEAMSIITDGKNQSMEINEETLQGHWAENIKTGYEFFIINDAVFSKLCILGDDVEPCFEGASITAPQVSANFTRIDDNFKQTLFKMMKDLEFALKGEKTMENNVETIVEEITPISTEEQETSETFELEEDIQDKVDESSIEENQSSVEEISSDFKKNEEDEEDEEEQPSEEDGDSSEEDSADDADAEEDEDEKKRKYSLLESDYNELKVQFENLQAEYQELVSFKQKVEKEEKENLISQFYMLSDEDKKDVTDNIDKYTLSEIKSKLAVICFDKKVTFDLDNNEKNDNTIDEVVTYVLDDQKDSTPDWVKEVERRQNEN